MECFLNTNDLMNWNRGAYDHATMIHDGGGGGPLSSPGDEVNI